MRNRSNELHAASPRIRFIYFDLDDTLLDHRGAEQAALHDLAHEVLNVASDSPIVARIQQTYRERNHRLWGDYSAGIIGKDELRHRRFQPIADEFRGHRWDELDSFYMRRYADYWAPLDGALEVFDRVARRFAVGIITHGFSETQHAKLDRFPVLRNLSRAVVISEEVGFLKPDQRLFRYAEDAAGVPGSSILYAGDSLRSDVEGALAAGWGAAWYTDDLERRVLDGRVFAFREWEDFAAHLAV